ncbi:MAG: prepilin-type N-terminal cleavage/methylation domain-containing protein [Candidatus Wolfebacteria bacterium]|nr:prepilin-type N-terminal cleavage/methylation domain-containing protein [Candidatus Wolfebacteria bacterium]
MGKESSFTLIELLIVIGILAVLATVAVLALNPLELIRQARDSTRMTDLNTLNKALSVYQSSGQTNLGTANTIYISIPSSQANCSDLGLPTSSRGWSYACVVSSTLRDSDGTGWIPLNFTAVSYGTPLEKLPVDPINTTSSGNYYTYVMGGSWELTTEFESQKYHPKAINDVDSYPGVYSVRTSSASLTPGTRDYGLVGYWKFDEGSGTLYDSSGRGNNGTQAGGVTYGVAGRVGNALSFDGLDDYVTAPDSSSLNFGTRSYSVSLWVKKGTTAVQKQIIGKQSATDSPGWVLYQHGNNNLTWLIADGSGSYNSLAGSPINDNIWHYIVAVADRNVNKLYLYVDSIPYAPGNITITGGVSPQSYALDIAGRWGRMDGLIDEVRLYNRALSAAEVMAIYNATR